jgi:DNA-binding MarR family transcriptional regulator
VGLRITVADYRALAELRYQLRRFLQFSEQMARSERLEPRQHQLLLAIKGLPEGVGASVGALAERLQIRHHSAVELVDRMEAGTGDDRRRVIVRLTPRGERLLARLSRFHRTELRSIAPALLRALHILVGDGSAARRRNRRRDS